jgi:hypothetical protein
VGLVNRLLPANPGIQVSTLLSGSLSTPSAKQPFDDSKTYQLIGATIVSSTQATVTFSNISTSYTHLILMGNARQNNSNTNGSFVIRWNGGTSTDSYGAKVQMYKLGTSTYGNSGTLSQNGAYVATCGNVATSNVFGRFRVVIPNYRDTNKYRGALVVSGYDTNTVSNGSYDDGTITNNAITSSTSSALTSIECYGADSFLAGSRLQLYGVK